VTKAVRAAAVAILAAIWAAPANAEPTNITVRVISKDAKFIGTSMGGALITIHEEATGELLAKGRTEGGTGDTSLIIMQDRKRGVPISTGNAAKFDAVLDLATPRQLRITAFGPMAQRQSANEVSVTQWVVPGKHLTGGDALILEMPGLVVDVLSPPTHVRFSGMPQVVDITANVTMMCGCPIEPGGLWDANKFEVAALLRRNGESVGELALDYAGRTSQFAAGWQIDQPGVYEAVVYAYDAANGNTGLDRVTFIVTP
jgi:hypothetical protein